MGDIAKAMALFKEAGLAFPVIPKKFVPSFKEFGPWLYSTRPIDMSPYDLDGYIKEAITTQVDDYVLLSHSGHGFNSYAIQYYLVFGPLRMFLFLGWGGAYMNKQEDESKIMECFTLADQITKDATEKLCNDSRLTIVVSDFYGSYWSPNFESDVDRQLWDNKTPHQVLGEALDWITDKQC